jgi:acylphosphatase
MSGIVTRQIRVSGRVQGVGYRAGLREQARARGLAGWVRNRADGSVEAVVRGAPDAVDALIAWARRGPPAARVSDVQVGPAPQEALPPGFELRPTAP